MTIYTEKLLHRTREVYNPINSNKKSEKPLQHKPKVKRQVKSGRRRREKNPEQIMSQMTIHKHSLGGASTL